MQPQPIVYGRRPAPAPAPSWADEANGLMANFYRGTGIGDEAVAGLNAGLDMIVRPQARADPIGAYKAKLAEQRRYEDAFRARHPVVAGGAQLAVLGRPCWSLSPAKPTWRGRRWAARWPPMRRAGR